MQAWASDKWFSIVLQFRTNPQQFFADNQVSSDDFLLGILKVQFSGLYSTYCEP